MKNKNQKENSWEKKFVEKGADLEHKRWAGWQSFLFSKSEWTENGYLIPKELCIRWQRQIDTLYSKLSEEEKESDRIEVRKYLPLIRRFFKSGKEKNYQRFIEVLEELNEFVETESGKSGRKEILQKIQEVINQLKDDEKI